jgi:hypothetical protein
MPSTITFLDDAGAAALEDLPAAPRILTRATQYAGMMRSR